MIFFLFVLFFVPLSALASSVSGGAVPWSVIISQVVNFSILIILAKVFLTKILKNLVKNKKTNFLFAEKNIKNQTQAAQNLLKEWKTKFKDLSDTFLAQISTAKNNSSKNSELKLLETKQYSFSLLEKAKTQIQSELKQAKRHLAELLLQSACNQASENQKQKASENRINLSFLKNIKNTRPSNEKN